MNKQEIVSILKSHLKIGGHDAWEGHYYYVDGIEDAASALLAAPQPLGVAQRSIGRYELAEFLCETLALESFDSISRDKYLRDAKAILEFLADGSAVAQAVRVPDGWQLVPKEPVLAMTMMACDVLPSCEHIFGHGGVIAANVYRKMLGAAPVCPALSSTGCK